MFIIEFIIKKFICKKEEPLYNSLSENENKNYEGCEHVFMPIDSTNEVLSCTKCGMLVNHNELKDENFFISGVNDLKVL